MLLIVCYGLLLKQQFNDIEIDIYWHRNGILLRQKAKIYGLGL